MTAPSWSSWEMTFWDPERWLPGAIRRRCGDWVNATPWRRRWVWLGTILFAFLVLPAIIGTVVLAVAEPTTLALATSPGNIDILGVKDSLGVPLSKYTLVFDHGGILEPGKTGIALLLDAEFAGYITLVTLGIGIMFYAFSFAWMNWFVDILSNLAKSISATIATPALLLTAATIGTFFVAWMVTRGFAAKAAVQIVTMLLVAVFGSVYLADPLADVLGEHGLLIQGRNLGVAVAAGLNGNSSPDPTAVVRSMQGSMADNLARHPVQVWNFDHVVDDRSARCKMAWSAGTMSGSTTTLTRNLKTCGDLAAHDATKNPSVGQLGTGLLLLIFATILLLFGLYLGLKVMRAGLDAVYHALLAIFGFAAGGFVYGPTQTFLIRNLVDAPIAGARMLIYSIFVGIDVLLLDRLFDQATGQPVSIVVLAGVLQLIFIGQTGRMGRSLDRGSDWISARMASMVQSAPPAWGGGFGGGGGGGGGGGIGGRPLGMGPPNNNPNPLLTQTAGFAAMATIGTVGNSPLTGQLFRARDPFQPNAFRRNRAEKVNWARQLKAGSLQERVDQERTNVLRSVLDRKEMEKYKLAAERELKKPGVGGLSTRYGVSRAIWGAMENGAFMEKASNIALDLGADKEHVRKFLRVEEMIDSVRDPTVPADVGRAAGAFKVGLDQQRESRTHTLHGAELAAMRNHVMRYGRGAPLLGEKTASDPYGLRSAIHQEALANGWSSTREAEVVRGIEAEAQRLRKLARGEVDGLARGVNHLTKEDFKPYYHNPDYAKDPTKDKFTYKPDHGQLGDINFQGDKYAHMLVQNQLAGDMQRELDQYLVRHAIDPTAAVPSSLLNVVNEMMGFDVIRRGGTPGPGNVIV